MPQTQFQSTQSKDSFGKRRWLIIGLLFLGWALANLDRFSINFAAMAISQEFGFTASAMGFVMSAFFIGYAIMQIPAGLLADKVGPRKLLLIVVLVWSIFTCLTGVASTFGFLIVCRLIFGLGEGSFLPASNKAQALLFSPREIGRANSIVMAAATVMATLSPIIVSGVIAAYGWRTMFMLIGALGVVVAVLFFFLFKIPTERDGERREVGSESSPGTESKGSFKAILRSPFIWSCALASFCIYVIMWGTNSWVPTLLSEKFTLGIVSVGWTQTVAQCIGIVSCLVGGVILDKLSMRASKILIATLSVICAIALIMMVSVNSVGLFVLFQIAVTAIMTFVILVPPIFIMKRYSKLVVGAAVGFIGFGGQLGSVVSPFVMGALHDAFGSFTPAFYVLAAIALAMGIAFLTCRERRTASEETIAVDAEPLSGVVA